MANNQVSLGNLLSKYSEQKKVAAKKEIFSYGDPADEIYLILKGLIRIFIREENGEEKEIARLSSRDILGELALLDITERSSRAVVYREATLLVFSPKNLRTIIHEPTILNEKIINSLCNQIKLLQKPNVRLPNLAEQETKNNEQETETPSFFLNEHGQYSKVASPDLDYYLYSKKIDCPVCSTEIKINKVRNSRLRLQDIRDDLRPVYKKFKPEWYKVWVCPNCFYAARKDDFFDFNSRQKEKIRRKFKVEVQQVLGSDYQIGYSEPRSLNEVFTSYYLAIELYNLIDASKDKLAYLWLRLNWLYEDVEEETLSYKASQKAMQNLREFYFKNDRITLARGQKDKLTLLLATLLYKHDKRKKALPLLDDLIRSPQTNRRQKQIARNKFISIRRELKKEKKEAGE